MEQYISNSLSYFVLSLGIVYQRHNISIFIFIKIIFVTLITLYNFTLLSYYTFIEVNIKIKLKFNSFRAISIIDIDLNNINEVIWFLITV